MVQQVPWHAVSNGGGEDAPQLLLKGFKRVLWINLLDSYQQTQGRGCQQIKEVSAIF